MNQSQIAAFLAAGFVFGTAVVSLAQTAPDGKKVKVPSQSTGSGKDTGMNIPSGMSGNGPGGVGTVGAGTVLGKTSPAKTSASSSKKKGAKHSKKKTMSSTSPSGSAATATQ